jgi:tetratricopeptide (TPR) repeat protein
MKPREGELILTPEAEEALEALGKALRWSTEHALFFAIANSLPAQRSLTALLEQRLEPERIPIVQVTLESAEFHPIQAILERCPLSVEREDLRPCVIFGLEHTLASSQHREAALSVLNLNREQLREYFQRPMIFWLLEYLVDLIGERAPDFWAWRSGVYYFPVYDALIKELDEVLSVDFLGLENLSEGEAQKQVNVLERQLDEIVSKGHVLVPDSLQIQAQLQQRLGALYLRGGDYSRGRRSLESSLESFRRVGNQSGLAMASLYLGMAARGRGEYEATVKFLEASRDIFQSLGDSFGLARALHLLGAVAYDQGDFATAADRYHELSQIARSLGDRRLVELCEAQLRRLAVP